MYTLLSRSWCMIYKEKTLIKIMISSFFFFVVAMMVQISPINYFKNNRAMSLIHSPVKSWGGCLNLYDEKVSDINAPNKLIKKEKNFEILTRVLQFQDKLMLYIYNSVHLRRHRVDLLLLQKEHLVFSTIFHNFWIFFNFCVSIICIIFCTASSILCIHFFKKYLCNCIVS